jgi:ABC-type branched-subunit amino acid transport system substrate-binding protein
VIDRSPEEHAMSSYESSVEPIRIGYLADMTVANQAWRDAVTRLVGLVFREGYERGMLDRPVELVYHEVEGLPKGGVKAVVDGFAHLVDQGCLAIIGPGGSENAVALGRIINERFKTPAITMAGTEEWPGEWTFALPLGSMIDEPIAWARMIAKRGHRTVGVLVEQAYIGETYLRGFRKACRGSELRILAEEPIAQTGQDVSEAVRRLRDARPDVLLYAGFGMGVLRVNEALRALDWDPPKFMGTSWQFAFATPALWQAMVGWIGMDNYDEGNPVGQAFIDRFEKAYGYRVESFSAVARHDLANVLLHALADAQPLSPLGVKEALERIKLLPAACGAPGMHISFGKWMRRGWTNVEYVVAREVLADGKTHRLVDRHIFD